MEKYKPKHPFFAGFLTGGVEICITYPLEYIKVQMQLEKQQKVTMKKIIYMTANKGFRGFYSGISSWLLFSFPRSATRFKVFEDSKKILTANSNIETFQSDLICGTLAGAIEGFFLLTPMQCLQIKMNEDHKSKTPQFSTLSKAILGIARRDGLVQGYFAGVWPTVWKAMLNNGIRFTVFNKVIETVSCGNHESNSNERIAKTLLAGAFAGFVSAVATHPIDTIKSQLQSFEGSKFSNSCDCLSHILRMRGWKGLYSGLVPRVFRVCLEIALQFTLYEQIGKATDKVFLRQKGFN